MFLVRGMLWGSALMWCTLMFQIVREQDEMVPIYFTFPVIALICYLICFTQWIIRPGHTIWKETIALGLILLFPFMVGAALIVVGVIGGIRDHRRKKRVAAPPGRA